MLSGVSGASGPVSRVLSFKTAIYLDVLLPTRSSRLPGTAGPAYVSLHGVAPDRVYSDGRFHTPSGELLPRLSTIAGLRKRPAVYFCCTFPRVAPGGCYPLSLPYGARTFLTPGPFAPGARLSSPLAFSIIPEKRPNVKSKAPHRLTPSGGWSQDTRRMFRSPVRSMQCDSALLCTSPKVSVLKLIILGTYTECNHLKRQGPSWELNFSPRYGNILSRKEFTGMNGKEGTQCPPSANICPNSAGEGSL